MSGDLSSDFNESNVSEIKTASEPDVSIANSDEDEEDNDI